MRLFTVSPKLPPLNCLEATSDPALIPECWFSLTSPCAAETPINNNMNVACSSSCIVELRAALVKLKYSEVAERRDNFFLGSEQCENFPLKSKPAVSVNLKR